MKCKTLIYFQSTQAARLVLLAVVRNSEYGLTFDFELGEGG